MAGYCAIDWGKALHALTPYEHLERFYRYCVTHFMRNITKMRSQITPKVREAMISLASSEPLPDFEGTLDVIRGGGKKAAGKDHSVQTVYNTFTLFISLVKGQAGVCDPSFISASQQNTARNLEGLSIDLKWKR